MPRPAVIQPPRHRAGGAGGSLDAILREDATRAVFQPVVDLEADGAVIGYEALARGPAGSPLARPDALFDAARAGDLVGELDWTCRATAFGAALDDGLPRTSTLFVNVDPAALGASCPTRFREVFRRAREELRVVVEVPERALVARPAELLAAAARVRELGWGLALDDLGSDRRALALLSLLQPDVMKLDLRLLRGLPRREVAEVAAAVGAEAERTGARVLAEGIEDDDLVTLARSLGATLGQGWRFGRPGPLPERFPSADGGVQALEAPSPGLTPFMLLSSEVQTRGVPRELVSATIEMIQRQAEALAERAVVLSALGDARPATTRGHPNLAVEPAALAPDDPLRDESSLVVIAPHFAAAVAARASIGGGPGRESRLSLAVTYDRALALRCARSLLARLAPADPGSQSPPAA